MITTRKMLLPVMLLALVAADAAWAQQEVTFPPDTQPVAAPAQAAPAPADSAQPGSAMPAMAPTSASQPGAAVQGTAGSPAGAQVFAQQRPEPARVPAKVSFAGGRLEVTASNSSLNSILRGISKATGMKVTGGVTEERVYGHYGPDTPTKVIADLLQGTGFNFLLRERAPNQPSELVLTPQKGSVTPPPPFAKIYDDEPVTVDGITSVLKPLVGPPPSTLDIKPPMPGTPTPVAVAPAVAGSTPATPAAAAGTLKTPEQVLEELKRMNAAPQAPQPKQAQTQPPASDQKPSSQQ